MANRVRVVVDNRLRLARADLDPECEAALVAAFTHRNPKLSKNRAMGFSTWGVEPTICTARMTAKQLTLPRGGTQQVRDVLAARGLAPEWVDRRLTLEPVDMPELRLTLRGYQAGAVEAMARRENCILRAPTGSGKTCAAFALIVRLRQPALVVLWSAPLLKQWKDRLKSDLGMRDRDIGIIRGRRRSIAPITLAMQQSLWARGIPEEVSGNFGLVLIDEAQRVAAQTVRTVIDAFPARYRFAISADERRKDGMDFLTREMFGPVAADIKRRDLVREGAIHDVAVRVVPTEFEAPWYGDEEVASAKDAFDFNRLLDEMTHDERRNGIVLGTVACEAEGGRRVLVFTHRVEHARMLSDAITVQLGQPCGLLIGGPENAVRFEEDRAAILDGRVRVAVGTVQAIGQGLDLPSVDRGVVATPVAGNKQLFDQVRGRICRRADGKEDAELIYLLDWRVYPSHLKNIEGWCDEVSAEWETGIEDLRERCAALVRARREARVAKSWTSSGKEYVPGFDDPTSDDD